MNIRCGFQKFGKEPCSYLLIWRHGESWCIAHGTRFTPYEAWDKVTEADDELNGRLWEKWEINRLQKLWPTTATVEDIARHLKRTKNAVYMKAWILGLSRRKRSNK